jgi:hypothetical protein
MSAQPARSDAVPATTLQTTRRCARLPGDFELHLRFKHGYRHRVPTPDEVLVNIAAERVDGRLYDGFCGVIIGSTPLPVGEPVIHPEGHRVAGLRDLIDSGCITLRSDFGWLLYDKPWERPDAPRTWEAVEALSGNTPIRAHGAALTSNAAAVICQSEPITALNVLEPTWDTGKLDPTPVS